MARGERKNWRDLCKAPGAKDPEHLPKIVQDLDQVLKREEQIPAILREP